MNNIDLISLLNEQQRKELAEIVFAGLRKALSKTNWDEVVREAFSAERVWDYVLEPEIEDLQYSLVNAEEFSDWLTDLLKKVIRASLLKVLKEEANHEKN